MKCACGHDDDCHDVETPRPCAVCKCSALHVLSCDMERDCPASVTHLDNKGFVYCTEHGIQRRQYGTPCRKLRPWELKRLQRGQQLRSY